jgi:hypothetical protein
MNIQFVDSCNCGLLATNLVKIHFVLVINHAERQMDTLHMLLLWCYFHPQKKKKNGKYSHTDRN